MSQSPRTKAKIKENVGLLVEHFQKKFGGGPHGSHGICKRFDDDDEQMLWNALSWTADDVEAQLTTAEPPAGTEREGK